jgi:uncharacterized membrane protein YsdA (DUF1294 family)
LIAIDITTVILTIYVLLNVCAFLLYGIDKRKAERKAWRTPERTLLFFSLLGPFGAWAGMQRFRHKTAKTKFRLVPVFMVGHAAAIGLVAAHLAGLAG